MDFRFQFGNLMAYVRHGGFVAFGQFLHALGEGLTDAIHLTMDIAVQRGQPFVVHHQRLNFGLGELGILGIGFGVKRGLSLFDLSFEFRLAAVEIEPFVENVGFGFFLVSILSGIFRHFQGSRFAFAMPRFGIGTSGFREDLLQAGGDVGLVHLVQPGEGALFSAVFLLQFGECCRDAFQLGRKLVDGFLLLGKVAGNDEGFGDKITRPALVYFFDDFAFLVFSLLCDSAGRCDPAIGGDEVAVILHGLGPIIHEVLIDVIVVDKRLVGVMGEQVFGEVENHLLRMNSCF